MTLEQYANLFEIIGGAIVIITLIFLVIQLRQNTVAVKSATVLGSHNTTLTVYGMLMEDSMIEVLVKGMPRPSDLTAVEKAKFNAFWTATLQNYQHSRHQMLKLLCDCPNYEAELRVHPLSRSSILLILKNPNVR